VVSTLLAIDASSAQCSIALSCSGHVLQSVLTQSKAQTKQLLPSIKALLAELQLSYQQLDALVLGVGPGRFTGLRVASSVVQGIAMAAGLPVVCVSSLQLLAQSAYHINQQVKRFLVVTNAYMQEVYVGRYEALEGVCKPVCQDAIMSPDGMPLAPFAASPWAAIGDGWVVYQQALESMNASASYTNTTLFPQAKQLLFLGECALQAGEGHDYQQALPNYLRRAQAWKKTR
jgi:tRNA threonylcarbamoyladenosine biosynthesis protein TsaB